MWVHYFYRAYEFKAVYHSIGAYHLKMGWNFQTACQFKAVYHSKGAYRFKSVFELAGFIILRGLQF